MAGPRILCAGAATLDTIFQLESLPTASGKYIPLEAIEVAAGMASSAGMSAARLGASVSICACVGDDSKGEQIVSGFLAEGIDVEYVRRVAGRRSAFCTILVDRGGDRIIVPRYDPELLADVSWLPVDALPTFAAVLVDVRWPAAGAAVLEAARTAEVPSVLDADVAPLHVLHRLVPLASHCVFSEPAALDFTGTVSVEAALACLRDLYPSAFMAITAGPHGCFWFDAEAIDIRNTPAPAVDVVDTLSAGDVFHGVFALGLAERRPMEECIARANAAASFKCTRFGGRLGAPSRIELEAFMAAQARAL